MRQKVYDLANGLMSYFKYVEDVVKQCLTGMHL